MDNNDFESFMEKFDSYLSIHVPVNKKAISAYVREVWANGVVENDGS